MANQNVNPSQLNPRYAYGICGNCGRKKFTHDLVRLKMMPDGHYEWKCKCKCSAYIILDIPKVNEGFNMN